MDGPEAGSADQSGELFFYTASGHGSWEATLVNLLSPGDTVLVLESGYFSEGWADMAAGAWA